MKDVTRDIKATQYTTKEQDKLIGYAYELGMDWIEECLNAVAKKAYQAGYELALEIEDE